MKRRRSKVGTRHPLGRAYVFDFGTCVSSFVYLEEYLRNYVLHRRVLAAKWPLRMKKLERVLNSLDEKTLPDLIKDYEALTEHTALAAEMTQLSRKRNALMHIIPPIHDPKTFKLLSRKMQAHRDLIVEATRRVHAVMLAVEEADARVFEQLDGRRLKEPSGSARDLAIMAKLLSRRQERFEAELRA